MKKLFKWSGGKSKEAKVVLAMAPSSWTRLVEPFAGSAAVSFAAEAANVLLCDLDPHIYNFYNCCKLHARALEQLVAVSAAHPFMLRGGVIHSLEKEYYRARQYINALGRHWQPPVDGDVEAARCFYVVRALAFSGMLRGSPDKMSNVAYGWYRGMKLLQVPDLLTSSWEIQLGSYANLQLNEGDWLFLDPPYRGRAGYPVSDWTDNDHKQFLQWCKMCPHNWLLVHTVDEMYLQAFDNDSFNIERVPFRYSQNFRGRDNSSAATTHLYIRNY